MGTPNVNIQNCQFIPTKLAQILSRKQNLNTHNEVILEELPLLQTTIIIVMKDAVLRLYV